MIPEKLLPVFKFLKSHHFLRSSRAIDDLVWYANWRASGGRGYCSNMKAAGVRDRNVIGVGLIDHGLFQSEHLRELEILAHVRRLRDKEAAKRRRFRESSREYLARSRRSTEDRRDWMHSL